MANSMLNSDNTYMNRPKFKKHRKRFPPTLEFLSHATVRLAEIASRIGILWWSCIWYSLFY